MMSLLDGIRHRPYVLGVPPYDASAMLTAASLLCVLGLIASSIPAIRAARIDPVTALRAD